MLDGTAAADLDLILSPGDAAEFVARGTWHRRNGRMEACQLWLVLHRRHGCWTHAYRVVPDRRLGHPAIYLERALEGDRRAELRTWLDERVRDAGWASLEDASAQGALHGEPGAAPSRARHLGPDPKAV